MEHWVDGQLSKAQARKCIFAATLGCGLEFYDFLTFAFFAIQIGHTFFPSSNAYLSLMGSLAVFGTGFIGRPVGAFVLGGYGDRVGRKPAMMLSMAMMGTAIAALALTPGYATIGIAAPIIAVLARFVQGFALGGEVGSATTYMVEAGGIARRGRSASCQGICQGIALSLGASVGLTLSALLSPADLTSFGWRIALLLGVSIVPFAIWMRRAIPETKGSAEPKFDVGVAGPSHRQIVVLGLALIGAGTILNYVQTYMATFGQTELKLSTTVSMAAQLSGNLMIIIASVIGGIACDRWGRRPLLIVPAAVLVGSILPMIMWVDISRSVASFFAINLILGIFNNVCNPALYVAIAESLPPQSRSRGFALIYTFPVALLGGTTQMFVTWLLHVTGNILALGWYMTGIGAIGLIAALLLPESAPSKRGWEPIVTDTIVPAAA